MKGAPNRYAHNMTHLYQNNQGVVDLSNQNDKSSFWGQIQTMIVFTCISLVSSYEESISLNARQTPGLSQ